MKKLSAVLFIIFLLVVPFYLRLFPLRTSHYWDETVYLQHSEIFFSGRDNYSELDFRPPVLSILFFLGYFIWHNVFMAHIIVALLSVFGAYYLYLLGKELYNHKVGFIAGLTLAYSPLLIHWSHFTLTDTVALTFLIMSTYFFIRCRRYDWVLAGILLTVSVLTRFTSMALFLLFLLWWIFKKVKFWYLVKVAIVALVAMVPYLIYATFKTGFFLQPFITSSSLVQDYNVPMYFYLANLHILLYLGILGLLFYIYVLYKKKGDVNDLVLFLWALAYFLYMTKNPHKELRYIFPICLPLFLLSAKGFYHALKLNLKKKWFRFLGIALVLMVITVAIVVVKTPYLDRHVEDYDTPAKLVGEWLKENGLEGRIYTNAEHPVLAYYSGLEIVPIYPRDETIYDVLFNKLDRDGYFIYNDLEVLWGSGISVHPNREFFDSNHHFELVKSFDGYKIYKYSLIDYSWVLDLAEIDEDFYVKELTKALAQEKDPFSRADIMLILGRLKNDPATVCSASDIFESMDLEGEEKAVVYETVASLGCVKNASSLYMHAADIWRSLGVQWRANLLSDLAEGKPVKVEYDVSEPVFNFTAPEFEIVTFGSSRFDVNALLVSQSERVSRDWLSAQIRNPYSEDLLTVFSERFTYDENELRTDIGWHEGGRIKDLGIEPRIAVGTLAYKVGDEWYAPDENGVFRFKISKEKIHYPTTRFFRSNLAMMVDTHGINTLVEQAVRNNANYVVGCCDLPSKIQAALYLNSKGIKVICFTDRFLYLALGKDSDILGSPPISGSVLGDRPLTINRDDVIVVMNGTSYYDTPTRYFSALSMPNTYYQEYSTGEMQNIIDRAEELDSDFIALRVFDSSDYAPVKSWLQKDKQHKVMLFHSVSYPYGKLLFDEFPEQTTFDNPNPIFS
ncbi:glycosyltransferase family 39 protein [Candidatus Woesearchaeota archaeon]|nr:glycosyltransferase family 39 protein [Candidatus Woesearchaeota archaeon]